MNTLLLLTLFTAITLFFIYCFLDYFLNPKNRRITRKMQGEPYIISVENKDSEKIRNFDLFEPISTLLESDFAPNGDYVNNKIVVSSGISSLKFSEILYAWSKNPFRVGLTYLQSATAGQILETIKVENSTHQNTLVPTIDPYQQQTTVLAIDNDYVINSGTSFKVGTLLPNTKLRIYLYPYIAPTKKPTLLSVIKTNFFKLFKAFKKRKENNNY